MKKIMLVLALAAAGLHNCYASPEDWTDTGKYGKNIKFLSDFLNEYKAQGWQHPMFCFSLDYLYGTYDIESAWSDKCSKFTENVVRINSVYKTDEGICLPYIGTGTLIDVGNDELRGKVVITCAHNVIDNMNIVSSIYGSSQDQYLILQTGSDDFFPKQDDLLTNKAYISVTPEPERRDENLPSVNTEQDAGNARHKVKKAYIYRKNGVMSDLAILILDNPIVNGENQKLPGEIISPDTVCGSRERNEASVLDNADFCVIGYGMTGFGQLPGTMGGLSEAVRENQLGKRQDLLQLLGWNKKKRVCLHRGLLSDRCIDRTFVDYKHAGGGFSGSLVISQPHGDGPIKYAGIYSGPAFKLSNETGPVAAGGSDPTVVSSPVDICEFIEFVKDQEFRQP
jgi:hypothetical protein